LLGNIPGTFLNAVCMLSAPVSFEWSRLIDFALSMGDPKAMQTHLCVGRWALDEFPIPKRLFEEIVEHLYREDRFLRGGLYVNNKLAAPEHIGAPILSVIDPHCTSFRPNPFSHFTTPPEVKIQQPSGIMAI
ncbi:MAG TPA: alpha/beta hydrolase, partial [Thermodesulfobacteriota bacterium]|nr:alpha/beta hydrolase [Thermodesulfobacteriota bacterium]